jgi:type VI secretion system secreted protein Hcp
MAFDAFLVFESAGAGAVEITGETQDSQMKDKGAFEIDSFGFGIENTINIGSRSGGAGAGKVQFNDFTVSKKTDSGSAGLFRTCCSGGHYGDVELILRRSGGEREKSGSPFLVYKFKLVAVKSVNWNGSDGDDVPTEEVVFEYGAIQIEYTPQKADGSAGATDEQKWSRVKNAAEFSV